MILMSTEQWLMRLDASMIFVNRQQTEEESNHALPIVEFIGNGKSVLS
jgi:hypothetical protein